MRSFIYRFLAALVGLAVHSGRSNNLEIGGCHQLAGLRREIKRFEQTDYDRSLEGAIAAALVDSRVIQT